MGSGNGLQARKQAIAAMQSATTSRPGNRRMSTLAPDQLAQHGPKHFYDSKLAELSAEEAGQKLGVSPGMIQAIREQGYELMAYQQVVTDPETGKVSAAAVFRDSNGNMLYDQIHNGSPNDLVARMSRPDYDPQEMKNAISVYRTAGITNQLPGFGDNEWKALCNQADKNSAVNFGLAAQAHPKGLEGALASNAHQTLQEGHALAQQKFDSVLGTTNNSKRAAANAAAIAERYAQESVNAFTNGMDVQSIPHGEALQNNLKDAYFRAIDPAYRNYGNIDNNELKTDIAAAETALNPYRSDNWPSDGTDPYTPAASAALTMDGKTVILPPPLPPINPVSFPNAQVDGIANDNKWNYAKFKEFDAAHKQVSPKLPGDENENPGMSPWAQALSKKMQTGDDSIPAPRVANKQRSAPKEKVPAMNRRNPLNVNDLVSGAISTNDRFTDDDDAAAEAAAMAAMGQPVPKSIPQPKPQPAPKAAAPKPAPSIAAKAPVNEERVAGDHEYRRVPKPQKISDDPRAKEPPTWGTRMAKVFTDAGMDPNVDVEDYDTTSLALYQVSQLAKNPALRQAHPGVAKKFQEYTKDPDFLLDSANAISGKRAQEPGWDLPEDTKGSLAFFLGVHKLQAQRAAERQAAIEAREARKKQEIPEFNPDIE